MSDGEGLAAALAYPECHEGVTRGGEFQPCNLTAVALRIDPTEGTPYPVCRRHVRGEMVPLSALAVVRGLLGGTGGDAP